LRYFCKQPNQWGYTAFWGNRNAAFRQDEWEITMCEYGLDTLQRNPLPCGTSPPSPVGIPGLGWVALKFLVQMWSTVGLVGEHAFEPAKCHALLNDGGDPVTNAENFAYMANIAYNMGLENDGPCFGAPCPGEWNPNPQLGLPQYGKSDLTSGGDESAAS